MRIGILILRRVLRSFGKLTGMMVLTVGFGVVPALAQDAWWEKQFKPLAKEASAVPLRPPAAVPQLMQPPVAVGVPTTVVPATVRPMLAQSRWRTVVIPVMPAPPDFQPSRTAVLGRARSEPVVAAQRPLIGYAHEMAGLASFYDEEQMTSSGERVNKHAFTAAHKTLPLGTRVRVTNLTNGRSAIVRINDRGPFKPGRVIDLSEAAAEQIAMTGVGLARVSIDVVK